MKKVAVILAGSGVYDGSEINEVVLTLLALENEGVAYRAFAPNVHQAQVINHLDGSEVSDSRNVLVEAGRIVRGEVDDLLSLEASEFDGVIIPGGFGVAKNLCNFAFVGRDFIVNPIVIEKLTQFATANKPAGYMCIAPVLIPKVYDNATMTIGNCSDTSSVIEFHGGTHQECAVNEIVIDEANNIVTTPAYMLATSIKEANSGITKLVAEVVGRL
ncbi:isoprenoid biosynthesis glyoxalase ElbB [Vibrio sp. SS-MA-C1-2]|uniref:isoprenoid biosynthesis glyoxalase ElbB n=1 Tax=Vibrio sp. SS-MA-C1-2 TaxID=2908646 RepID=UPI001F1BE4F6|nr:isoprenoid biosynthesis glyoxalase ElbB [Vibrio sp. SS-MA-C1-2]UJF17425.1 isoprenoid biosynthesis glyoxalase ElbB [Vibrio sp. SS-MA-C1-2]